MTLQRMAQVKLTNDFIELRRAFNNPAKFVSISAGRRSGKTFEAFDWLYKSLMVDGARHALWVDTRQSNIDKYIERYCMVRLEPIWKDQCRYDRQKKVLHILDKYIDFGSAEKAENLEGFQYDRILINEAGIALKRPQLWDNTIQPMTKGKENKTRIIGTPKGRNKFYLLYSMGSEGLEEYKSFTFSAYESPFWEKDELDRIKARVPSGVWQQEYMAQFLENNAGVFRGVRECVKGHGFIKEAEEGKSYVIGVDLAKHTDFTVVIVIETGTNNVVFMDRFNQIDWVFQKKKIIDIWERFNKCPMLLDSTGVGDPVFDDLYRVMDYKIEGYKITSPSKKELIEGLSLAIQRGDIGYPGNGVLISELEAYEYQISKSGVVKYNAPEGLHDDCVIALALAWQLVKPDNEEAEIYVF